MPAILYTCPVTLSRASGWLAERREDDGFEAIECIACRRIYVINSKTGKAFGAEDDSAAKSSSYKQVE